MPSPKKETKPIVVKATTIPMETKPVADPNVLKFQYMCPACSKIAIQTSNKMLGVEVDCVECGTRVKLDDKNRYQDIK